MYTYRKSTLINVMKYNEKFMYPVLNLTVNTLFSGAHKPNISASGRSSDNLLQYTARVCFRSWLAICIYKLSIRVIKRF